MRILMLGNSLSCANDLPHMLAEMLGAQVIHHTRGGARLSEHLNPATRLGARTRAALAEEKWDYVVLQEMSHGPITTPKRFFSCAAQLCKQIRAGGATPVFFATWAYQKGSTKLAAKGWGYDEMSHALSAAYQQAALKNKALLADAGRRFSQLADTQNLYAADGVHPNKAGSRVAAQVLAATIRAHQAKGI